MMLKSIGAYIGAQLSLYTIGCEEMFVDKHLYR